MIKHNRVRLIVAWLTLQVSFVAGCGQEDQRRPGEPYQITATVGMVADIVRQVVGDKAQVRAIIGEGVDPHLYRPTAEAARSTKARHSDLALPSAWLVPG